MRWAQAGVQPVRRSGADGSDRGRYGPRPGGAPARASRGRVSARGGAGLPREPAGGAGLCVAAGRAPGMPVGSKQAQEAVPVPPVAMPPDFIMSAKSLVSSAGGASALTFTP